MKIDAARLAEQRDQAQQAYEKANVALRAAQQKGGDTNDLRREVDRLYGYHTALVDLYDARCRFPVDPGTVMHGIDISRLNWQTRAMVMSRNLATIYALGGRPDPD